MSHTTETGDQPSPAPLEFDDVGFGFGDDPRGLFGQVNLSLQPGDVVAIRGDNGSGKSCLMRLAVGLYAPRVGQVRVFGRTLRDCDHVPHIGFVGGLPQSDGDLPFPPDLPVKLFRQVVTAALTASGVDLGWAVETADVLQLDDPHVRNKRFGQLSKGWQLRHQWWAAIGKPVRLLLLDEPFDGLDKDIKPAVFGLLRETVRREKAAVLLATHHSPEVADAGAQQVFELADRSLHPRATGRLRATVQVQGHDCLDTATSSEVLTLFSKAMVGEWRTCWPGQTSQLHLALVCEALLGEWKATLTVRAPRGSLGSKGGA